MTLGTIPGNVTLLTVVTVGLADETAVSPLEELLLMMTRERATALLMSAASAALNGRKAMAVPAAGGGTTVTTLDVGMEVMDRITAGVGRTGTSQRT